MVWKRKKKNEKGYDEKMSELAYNTVYDALQTVLTTEVKKTTPEGKEVLDMGLTISKMRMVARVALDFVNDIDKDKT